MRIAKEPSGSRSAEWSLEIGASAPQSRHAMNTEVWQCPECRARADLLAIPDGVLLTCDACGFIDSGRPAAPDAVE
jgi:hypothetical protein